MRGRDKLLVTDVLMPKMSLGMVEGKIVKWMKKGGEKVKQR